MFIFRCIIDTPSCYIVLLVDGCITDDRIKSLWILGTSVANNLPSPLIMLSGEPSDLSAATVGVDTVCKGRDGLGVIIVTCT